MTISYAHLLIVDADEHRRRDLCDSLRQNQLYNLSEATDIPTARQIIRHAAVDVLLLDATLAPSEEQSFLPAIREIDPEKKLKILLIVPAGNENMVQEGLKAGANDWLYYPADPALLKARCDLAIQQISLEQQLLSAVENFQEIMQLARNLRETILPLGIALSAETDFDRLLERILREAKAICHADAAALFLLTSGNNLQLVLAQYDSIQWEWHSTMESLLPMDHILLDDEPQSESKQQDVLARVALTGQAINISNIDGDDSYLFSSIEALDQASGYKTISILSVSLWNERIRGVLLLMNALEPESGRIIPFSRYQVLLAESLAAQAGVVIHNHALREQSAKLLVLEDELRIGRQIQMGFFPAELPQPAGWQVAASLRPAHDVGGDFYDVFSLPDDRLVFVVADVCGKGVGSALFMSLIRTLIRAFIEREVQNGHNNPPANDTIPSLIRTINFTNHYVMANHAQDHMFATLFIGLLEPQTGELLYVNAGHVSPLLQHNGQGPETRLTQSGPAVGLMKEAVYRLKQTTIAPGEGLLIFTDGVIEAPNAAGKPFGYQRLSEVMSEPGTNALRLLAKIDKRVASFTRREEPWDDVTMMAIRRLSQDAGEANPGGQ